MTLSKERETCLNCVEPPLIIPILCCIRYGKECTSYQAVTWTVYVITRNALEYTLNVFRNWCAGSKSGALAWEVISVSQSAQDREDGLDVTVGQVPVVLTRLKDR
jgi:hypothetical protein